METNRKTAYIFTPILKTAGHLKNQKTEEKLSKNRKTAVKKVPKPQNRKQDQPFKARLCQNFGNFKN